MKSRARRALNAVPGPDPTAIFEADVIGRMPVSRCEDRHILPRSLGHQFVQLGDDSIAFRNAESASRTEIVLHVDDEQGIVRLPLHMSRLSFEAEICNE